MELREDDLFTVANSLAELIGAPVTIEDQDTTVVAYSGGDSPASGHYPQAVDDARIGTILGRQVPHRYRELLSAEGVFDRLQREHGVVYVALDEAEMTPRAVIAIRDGAEVIGSIWAAVTNPPTAEQELALKSAVPVVARHMSVERDRADAWRTRRDARVRALLDGGDQAMRAAEEVGLRESITVAAIAPANPTAPASPRLLGSVSLHLDALATGSVCGHVGDVVYAVIGAPEGTVRRILGDYIARLGTPSTIVVAVGRQVENASQASRSRSDSDYVLDALRHGGRAGVVATLRETLADVLALQVADVLDGIDDYSPLTALSRFDGEHGSELFASARAYLDHGGDVAGAAAALHVHPNTLRNRLRRAREACGVDLRDRDTRLVLMLHLRVTALAPPDL